MKHVDTIISPSIKLSMMGQINKSQISLKHQVPLTLIKVPHKLLASRHVKDVMF